MIDKSSSQWLCTKPTIENGNITANVFHTSTKVRYSRKSICAVVKTTANLRSHKLDAKQKRDVAKTNKQVVE